MKKSLLLFIFLTFCIISCSDDHEPTGSKDTALNIPLVGRWIEEHEHPTQPLDSVTYWNYEFTDDFEFTSYMAVSKIPENEIEVVQDTVRSISGDYTIDPEFFYMTDRLITLGDYSYQYRIVDDTLYISLFSENMKFIKSIAE